MSEPLFEKVFHDITGHIPRHGHHRHDPDNDTPEEHDMDLPDTLKTDLTDGLDYAEGLIGRIKAAAPEVLARVQKYASSPVLAALEEAGEAIDPAAETVIAGWIRDLASLKLGTTTPAPAPDPAPAS
jgi:hypothetical protein